MVNAKIVELNRRRRLADPAAYNATKAATYARLRSSVLSFLGGVCKECCESDQLVLQVDHLNGGGTQELRKVLRETWYRRILRGEAPSPVQLLCANCNRAKSYVPSKNAHTAQMRRRALARTKLGDRCNQCPCNDARILQVDHVNSDGASERHLGPDGLAKRVLEDTDGRYQLLCANCNWRKKTLTPAERPGRKSSTQPELRMAS